MAFLRKPRRGFVLGKFMPPHNGHVFMCDFARHYVDRLTILVCSLPSEPIPGALRFAWMKEMFPGCDVQWINEVLPQEPQVPDDFAFRRLWRDVVLQCGGATASGPAPFDVVFASEEYGRWLAAEVGAEFVPVDMGRLAVPISGAMVRERPFENWEFLPPVVRPYYVKRVTVFGPESTGKSTLCRALAEHYRTIVAPEYGRTYTEMFGTDVNAEDLRRIVQGHVAAVAAAKHQANRILIEDTDPVMTGVWSDLLVGGRHDWFGVFRDYADLYLLSDVDLPWIDDGTRYFRSADKRRHFYEMCENELIARNIRYAVVRGQGDERTRAAIAEIDRAIFGGADRDQIRT
ncbi:MAG: AAA family ATPase [bacterium]|nr:AAA family ATPase [bacterium]